MSKVPRLTFNVPTFQRSNVQRTIVVIALALVALWLRPYALSIYHQERGGRLLDQAFAAEERAPAASSWPLLPEPLVEGEAQTFAQQAASRFRAAVAANPANAHAHRCLGRASLLLHEPLAAAEALTTYTHLRPDNSLGWWELALAYDQIDQWLQRPAFWALSPALDNSAKTSLLESSALVTASLQTADIETPEVPIDTPYCDRGQPPQSCFIAPTQWQMPEAPDGRSARLWSPDAPIRRDVLFMHSPSAATFHLTLPVTPTALVFWVGIDPAAHGWLGDGVVYEIQLDGRSAFTHALTADQARQGWHPGQADLTASAGQKVRLTLAVAPGPAGDGQGDWAGWGDVRLVRAADAPFALAEPARRLPAALQAGGFTMDDLADAQEHAP